MESLPPSRTAMAGSFSPVLEQQALSRLDLSTVPPISVLSAHFKGDEEDRVKATLRQYGAQLTIDASEAKIFVGKVGTKRRAEFELRSRKLKVEEVVEAKRAGSSSHDDAANYKRRKMPGPSGSSTFMVEERAEAVLRSGIEDEVPYEKRNTSATSPWQFEDGSVVPTKAFDQTVDGDIIWVVHINWLNACLAAGYPVVPGENLVFKGKVVEHSTSVVASHHSVKAHFSPTITAPPQTLPTVRPDILIRAREEATAINTTWSHSLRHKHDSRSLDRRTLPSSRAQQNLTVRAASLAQQTTSEYGGEDTDIPPSPNWVKQGIKYACQRFTPEPTPNDDFIAQLKKIRTARTLVEDEIGVRAYSTIIASIAAYPYKLSHPRELTRLPGCDEKTATLFVEWKNTGKIQTVENYETDNDMKVLRSFYDIWGVGAKTARQFYYKKHWADLDDIIEYGWDDLDRVQQIGVKYYDDFLKKIPRVEVEYVAEIIRQHAVRLRDDRITTTIVGGYRRGKACSGDADIIVSHPNLEATANLVKDIVESLEAEEWITHTLTLSLHNTHRSQSTLPFRTTKASGVGHDTLDKALVVWQDPSWPTRVADRAANSNAKNPNIHRRVDIVVAPWRTIGCAVLGWSGGTTFQRDLRRYTKHVKGWKFDSSGIRSRSTGEIVQLEGSEGVDGTPEDAEKKVFEGLGLEFIPPEYRCTN